MINIRHFILKIVNAGIDSSTLAKEKVQIIVLNSFSLLSAFLSPFFASFFLYLGHWQPAAVFMFICLWLIHSLIIHAKKKYTLFRFSLFACISAAIPLISMSLGINSGFSIYYFVVPVIAFHIFELKEKKKLISLFTLFTFSFIINQLLYLIPTYPWVLLEKELEQNIFYTNVFVCFVILSVLLYSIVSRESMNSAELVKTIKEKNVLLAEVHHRVKNNLAVISSMLRLQIKSSNSDEMNDLLTNNSNRIYSMSLTHDKLFMQDDVSKIEFSTYLKDLATQLCHTYQDIVKVKIKFKLKKVTIGLNEATSVGLILNEIVTNSIKHGFRNNEDPKIAISLTFDEINYYLTISDNGVGFDFGLDTKNESIGLIIIDSLVEQINGHYSFSNKNGANYAIVFPREPNQENN